MATEWMDSMLNPQISKEAAQVPLGENKETTEANKLQANAWISDLALNTDPEAVEKEYQEKLAEEARVLGKTAAQEEFKSPEQVIESDFSRQVKAYSDHNLVELLALARAHKDNVTMEKFADYKETAKKNVESGRAKCEEELLKLSGEHTLLDWQAAFKKFSKVEVEQPKEKDLFPKVEEKDVKFDSPTENKFKLPTKEEMVPAGNGREASERTEVTKQAVPVIKEASLETEAVGYQPKTGEPCSCKPGIARDNCPSCEGTGQKVDFKKIREQNIIPTDKKADEAIQPIKREQLYDQASSACPVCGGTGEDLGSLGQLDHMRCRDCGITYSHGKEAKCATCASLKEAGAHEAWDVYLNGKEIDTVFYTSDPKRTPEEVKKSLVEHDNYDPEIVVKKGSQEIKSQASKEEVIKKVAELSKQAEVKSPWEVIVDPTTGKEVIARVTPDLKKESEEENKDLQK